MSTASDELAATLDGYYGTENWYRHALNKNMLYTDGVQAFAEKAQAYWLLDVIATEVMPRARQQPGWEFLSIRLVVAPNATATLIVDDGDGEVLFRKGFDFTTCPEGTWSFYLTDSVLMLVTEY